MAGWQKGPSWVRLRGFTLIEIVFVLTIFAVLAAIALPNWGTLVPDYNLRGAARQVQSELHRIKSRAVSDNVSYQLVSSQTGDNYTIKRAGATEVIKSLPDGVDIRNSTTITFSSRGTATFTPDATVYLCNSKGTGYNIEVNATGRIRLCAPSACNGAC